MEIYLLTADMSRGRRTSRRASHACGRGALRTSQRHEIPEQKGLGRGASGGAALVWECSASKTHSEDCISQASAANRVIVFDAF